jgi:capsular polysaccharide biosynthesis protein
MPMGDFSAALRRRWLLVLIGVLMTVGLSGAAYMLFKPTYEITGTVLLLPPPSSSADVSANPYLQLVGLGQAVDLVGVALSDQATQLEFQAISKDVQYTIQPDVRTSSPLLLVDVKDSSPETALKIRDILVARIPVRLEEMQTSLGVSSKDLVTTTVVTLDAQAVEVGRNRLRAAVVAGVVGLGLTLVAAARWDARRLRHPRSHGRGSRSAEPDLATTQAAVAAVDPAETRVGTPVSPVSPPSSLDAREEPVRHPRSHGRGSRSAEPDLATTQAAVAAVDPAETRVGTPVSPVSPPSSLDAREEPADAPDDAPH